MRTIVIFIIVSFSVTFSHGQSNVSSSSFPLFKLDNNFNPEISNSDLNVIYLGSNKSLSKNYFFHTVTNKSTIDHFDKLPKGLGVLFCTDTKAQITWFKTLYNESDKSLNGAIQPIRIDEDRIILMVNCGKPSKLTVDSLIVNTAPQISTLLFFTSNGERIDIPFTFSDSEIPILDIKITSITKDGTFAFSMMKSGKLTVNNFDVNGEQGVYLCKAKIDFTNRKIDIIGTKHLGVNLLTSKSIKERNLRFDCTVLENKSIVVSNPSSMFFAIKTNDKIDTVVNFFEKCYVIDKNLETIVPIEGIIGKGTIFHDENSNICIKTRHYEKNNQEPTYTITVLNPKKEVVWKETSLEYWNSIYCHENEVYLLKKNLVRHNLKQISYNFDLKRIDVQNKMVKNYKSVICDNQFLNDVDLQLLSASRTNVELGYWVSNSWGYDWERGCIMVPNSKEFTRLTLSNVQ